MKTTLSREDASTVLLKIEASPEEVAPSIDRAVRDLSQRAKIPGFRKGHVPRKILETHLGAAALREATLEIAVPRLVTEAVKEQELIPLAPPAVDITAYELDDGLAFDARVEVVPEVQLPEAWILTVTRPSAQPTPAELDENVERLRERFATLETVDRPARRGDFLLLDVTTTTVLGSEVPELTGNDQLYSLGAGVPELDDQLENVRAGEVVETAATVPDGDDQKQVQMRALVKEVRARILPALDDEFAKTASEFDTLDELREDIRARIEKLKTSQNEVEVRNLVLEQALDDVEFEPPRSLVHREMAYRLQRMEEQLQQAGLTLEAYMQQQNVDEDTLEADLRKQGERNVRAQLLLETIARAQGFTATEEEVLEEVKYLAEASRADVDQLAKELKARDRLSVLAGDIIRRKALNHLVEQATVTDEDPQEATP